MNLRLPILTTAFALLLTSASGWSQSELKSSSAPLKSPWSASRHASKGDYTCPAVAALPHDIVSSDYYSDAKHSVIDPVRYAAYNKSQEVFRAQQDVIEKAADKYQKDGNPGAARCVVQILKADAAADAMTGSMSSNQANYVQGWTLGALAVSYLKIKDSGVVSADDHAAIAAWLAKVAGQVKDYFAARHEKVTNDGRNNHYYWAGFDVMAAAIAANDHPLFDWAASTYDYGVRAIQPDGTLPLEMDRGVRALHYHLFAMGPLVMMAEFGEDNGLPMYKDNNGMIHVLIKRTIGGLTNNTYFTAKAGIKQDTPEGGKIKSNDVIWAVPYVKRFPDPALRKLIDSVELTGWNYLGGLPPQ